jgi:hypothetical protein
MRTDVSLIRSGRIFDSCDNFSFEALALFPQFFDAL